MFTPRHREADAVSQRLEALLIDWGSALAVAVLAFAATTARAQQVAGIVRVFTGEPVGGAAVVMVDSGNRQVAQAITDAAGKYRIARPSSATWLRVFRIGYRPFTDQLLGEVPRDTSIDVTLERVPLTLSAVRVSTSSHCSDSPDRRGALQLWEQARAGLLATVIARQSDSAAVTMLRYQRLTDPRSRRMRLSEVLVAEGFSSRPFHAARSEEELARFGYADRSTGTQIFYAPDADVLLQESFAATHCFGVRAADAAHRGLLGLTFAPPETNRRMAGRVDVRGVLWIDPRSPELKQLEFQFTGIHNAAILAGAGGRIHFQTTDSGLSFIAEWSIVLPRMRQEAFGRKSPEVVDLLETGGLVARARWPDGRTWDSGLQLVTGHVKERGTNAPIQGALLTVAGLADSVHTDSTGFFELPPLPPGTYTLDITDPEIDNVRRARLHFSVRVGPQLPLAIQLAARDRKKP